MPIPPSYTLLLMPLILTSCMLQHPDLPAAIPEEKVVFQPPPASAPPVEPPTLAQAVPISAIPVVTPTKEELAPPRRVRQENPERAVDRAYSKSLISPSTEGYRGGTSAMQHYPYIPGQVYDIYSSPNHPTAILFPKGEWLAGEPDINEHYWDVGKQEMGDGEQRQEIITIRPIVAGLDSTAHFFTQSGLTFFCRLRSFAKTSMVAVSWDVPHRLNQGQHRQVGNGTLFPKRQAPEGPVIDPTRLHTAYTIEATHGKPPWVPLAVYDDGTKTVIKFKENLGFTAAPAPFAMDQEGKINLVQFTPYSVPGEPDKGTYYLVQGLWPKLELRGDGGMVVTITRQTGQPSPYTAGGHDGPQALGQ